MPKKTSSMFKCGNNKKILIIGCGFCLGVFGILCAMFWEDFFSYAVGKEMVLRPNSKVYDNWKSPPIALNLDIYFFNWTNPEDFKNFSTRPIMQQLGPYRFMEKPDKVDIKWHPENASVTYRRKSDFYFDAAGSKGSLSDKVVTLNAVALSAAGKAKSWNTVKRSMVDVGLKLYGQELSVIKTADELLFSGYSDDMIDIARSMPIFGSDVDVPFDKFGWFYTRNGSSDLAGVFNVHTGADDITKLGQMHTWNYKSHSGLYDSYCGNIYGSAGEFQPPNLKVGSTVYLFTPDMCRAVPLEYMETVDVEGVEGYKFAGGARSLDNGTKYPDNLCYCGGSCVPSGVMNISACRFGSPVFMSYPHFYGADPFYLQQVEGMQPEQSKHEFYMILEPRTGVPLEVAARFQVNMLVENIDGISLYEKIPRTFMPLIWFEQKVRIKSEMGSELQMLPFISSVGQISAFVCLGVGLIMLLWYPALQLWTKQRSYVMNTPRPENGHQKQNVCTTDGSLASVNAVFQMPNEMKTIKTTAKPENRRAGADVSPLLQRGDACKLPTIVPRASVVTASTVNNTEAPLNA